MLDTTQVGDTLSNDIKNAFYFGPWFFISHFQGLSFVFIFFALKRAEFCHAMWKFWSVPFFVSALHRRQLPRNEARSFFFILFFFFLSPLMLLLRAQVFTGRSSIFFNCTILRSSSSPTRKPPSQLLWPWRLLVLISFAPVLSLSLSLFLFSFLHEEENALSPFWQRDCENVKWPQVTFITKRKQEISKNPIENLAFWRQSIGRAAIRAKGAKMHKQGKNECVGKGEWMKKRATWKRKKQQQQINSKMRQKHKIHVRKKKKKKRQCMHSGS